MDEITNLSAGLVSAVLKGTDKDNIIKFIQKLDHYGVEADRISGGSISVADMKKTSDGYVVMHGKNVIHEITIILTPSIENHLAAVKQLSYWLLRSGIDGNRGSELLSWELGIFYNGIPWVSYTNGVLTDGQAMGNVGEEIISNQEFKFKFGTVRLHGIAG